MVERQKRPASSATGGARYFLSVFYTSYSVLHGELLTLTGTVDRIEGSFWKEFKLIQCSLISGYVYEAKSSSEVMAR
jgi:hypothetical protein